MKTHLTETDFNKLPEGVRISGKWTERKFFITGKELLPGRSLRAVNHSQDGFNWGYGGSGPAQLALGFLLEFLPKDLALEFYEEFKWKVIAGLPMADFEQEVKLRDIIAQIISERK